MYDFIKTGIKLNDVASYLRLLESKGVSYEGTYDGETGEVNGYYTARIKNITLQIYHSQWLKISGSIHEYWNDGKHNYNDFTLQDFIDAVEDLSETVGIDLWRLKLFTLEVGVNIIPSIYTEMILHNTFMHKKVDFKWASITGEGTYFHCKHKQYHIKLYDKAKQNELPYELLRYEINFKSEILKKHGIYKVADVLMKKNISFLMKFLVDEYSNIIFYDPTNKLAYIAEQQKLEWSNPRFWTKLSKHSSSKNIFANTVNSMRAFQAKHSDKIQNQILELVKVKLGELDNISSNSSEPLFGRIGKDFEEPLQSKSEEHIGSFGSSIIDPHGTEGPYCVVTKLGLSMQSSDARYLTLEGITYLSKNFPKTYTRLIELFAPRFLNESDSIRMKELEKSIRRKYKDILRKSTKGDNQDMVKLFD